MANLGNFNSDDYEDDYAPIPAGWYTAVITASESKPSKSGGEYLSLTIDIVDGQYKGRRIFANLNLKNANPVAESIAKADLANICRAVGVTHPRDSSELHNKPLSVKLSIKPESNNFPAGNDVKGWRKLDSTPAAPESAPIHVQFAQTEQPASGLKKPWEK